MARDDAMPRHWQLICKIKDVPLSGVRLVPRGLAWQELPGVALFRTDEAQVHAVLEAGDQPPREGTGRRYSVLLDEGRVYLDLEELRAPASRAEAALAGTAGVATRVLVMA